MEKAYKVHVIQLLTEVFNIMVYKAKEKSSLVSVNQPGEIFLLLTARIVECVSRYMFSISKSKQTRRKNRNTKKQKKLKKYTNKLI